MHQEVINRSPYFSGHALHMLSQGALYISVPMARSKISYFALSSIGATTLFAQTNTRSTRLPQGHALHFTVC